MVTAQYHKNRLDKLAKRWARNASRLTTCAVCGRRFLPYPRDMKSRNGVCSATCAEITKTT